jgi:hypothetical protein
VLLSPRYMCELRVRLRTAATPYCNMLRKRYKGRMGGGAGRGGAAGHAFCSIPLISDANCYEHTFFSQRQLKPTLRNPEKYVLYLES